MGYWGYERSCKVELDRLGDVDELHQLLVISGACKSQSVSLHHLYKSFYSCQSCRANGLLCWNASLQPGSWTPMASVREGSILSHFLLKLSVSSALVFPAAPAFSTVAYSVSSPCHLHCHVQVHCSPYLLCKHQQKHARRVQCDPNLFLLPVYLTTFVAVLVTTSISDQFQQVNTAVWLI